MIGFTCGAFDLLHAGHVLFLKQCKLYCDYFIVGLQVDPSVDRIDKHRPIQGVLERQIQLEACRYVDRVIVYETENDLLAILGNMDFDIRFLGSDYESKKITGEEFVKIKFIDRNHNWSSSELRERIKKA